MIKLRTVLTAAAATATLLALAACAPPTPDPSSGPTEATPTSTPNATPTPAGLAADVAFVVTGTLVSPDAATEIAFTMTVGGPEPETPDDVATFATSAHCPDHGGSSWYDVPAYVHVTFESELVRGDVSDADVLIHTNMGAQSWEGDYRSFQASCSDPLASPIPGTATATILVDSGAEVGQYNWIPSTGGYGLSAGIVDPETGEVDSYTPASCDIELGPAAAGTVATTLVAVNADFGCFYGISDS